MFRTCIEIKSNGIQCGSPALRSATRCYFHEQSHKRRYFTHLTLPPIGHPKGRLFAINEVFQGLIHNQISPDRARALLYAIQLSSQSVVAQDFGDKPPEFLDMVRSLGLKI
ncbi:MAG TPA: hypothetical protein VM056_04060 [Terriglobales bacterium]|nr:hypothetical protein [Terriglobales bacterium]